jgi:cysteine desulfurase
VAAIVGFGAACELAASRLDELNKRLKVLRDTLERGLHRAGATIFGERARRIPNTSYFAIHGIEGETLVIELDKVGYAVAAGAACSSANPEPSATLLAMGVAPEVARGAVRVSLGAATTQAHIDGYVKALTATAARLKKLTAMAV